MKSLADSVHSRKHYQLDFIERGVRGEGERESGFEDKVMSLHNKKRAGGKKGKRVVLGVMRSLKKNGIL